MGQIFMHCEQRRQVDRNVFSSVTPGGRMRTRIILLQAQVGAQQQHPGCPGRQCSQCLPPGEVELLLGGRFQG